MEEIEQDGCISGILSFDSHRYRCKLDNTGFTWTLYSIKGRNHIVPLKWIIGVHKLTDISFKIITVTEKDTVIGKRNQRNLFFETLLEEGEEGEDNCDKWVNIINAKAKARRPKHEKKLLVLVNPFSGQQLASKIWKETKVFLNIAGIEYEDKITEKTGQAKEIAKDLDLSKYRGIVCVSGDGLLNEVVNGLMAREDWDKAIVELAIGIIPGGSGNGLAASLGAPDFLTSAYAIIEGYQHPLDIFSMVQSNIRSYGFLAIAWAIISVIDIESESYRFLGSLRFDIKGLVEVLTCNSYRGRIAYKESVEPTDSDEQIIPNEKDEEYGPGPKLIHIKNNDGFKILDGEWSFLVATNTTRISAAAGALAPNARLSDGSLDLLFVPKLDRFDLARLLTSFDDGTLYQHPEVRYSKIVALEITPDYQNSEKAPITLDGERTDNSPVKVEVHKALARIFYDQGDK